MADANTSVRRVDYKARTHIVNELLIYALAFAIGLLILGITLVTRDESPNKSAVEGLSTVCFAIGGILLIVAIPLHLYFLRKLARKAGIPVSVVYYWQCTPSLCSTLSKVFKKFGSLSCFVKSAWIALCLCIPLYITSLVLAFVVISPDEIDEDYDHLWYLPVVIQGIAVAIVVCAVGYLLKKSRDRMKATSQPVAAASQEVPAIGGAPHSGDGQLDTEKSSADPYASRPPKWTELEQQPGFKEMRVPPPNYDDYVATNQDHSIENTV